ncbi:MAG: 2-C-methyl-D-erythritol 2,4-cyclodiphosphate synthase [Syntrophobacterales bacterium]|nr:2-C-methyl-D-erythritol 2,4-cyclodiphosphate synthase [Syntrophobacterales bacterium]
MASSKKDWEIRVGIGYDVHPFVKDRPLMLGGIRIPSQLGLAGHSDADVVLHAICDALLGAAGLGDIGRHFPDSDPKYKGISSMVLLQRVLEMVNQAGYAVGNIDVTVVAQKPRIAPYRDQMIRTITQGIGLRASQINIKATTTEGLGFTGREEGIAVYAVCLIYKKVDGEKI